MGSWGRGLWEVLGIGIHTTDAWRARRASPGSQSAVEFGDVWGVLTTISSQLHSHP